MTSRQSPPDPPDPADAAPPAQPGFGESPPGDEGGPTREVRFAVVMYGGVSLCIYINGISQELLHLVRATAPGAEPGTLRYRDDELTRTQKVYRHLGRLLNEERCPGTDVDRAAPVRTRFSVDILSGTSAGGINSIFLAKALANDEEMEELKQLWMTEADLAKLINDGASTAGTSLPRPTQPESLLNGQRMYQKLVAAFDAMDRKANVTDDTPREPLVPELDLFVTTTDIAGVTLPIRLADTVVHERRHRGVFHFQYRKHDTSPPDGHHFSRAHNPFLAFAARCTSSFPFAFEPMRLDDIDAVLDTLDARRGREGRSDDPLWEPFLEPFRTPPGTAQLDPRKRSFGDGGYLDNKPFSFAADELLHREGDVLVDRKLLYIEPAPEHPERDPVRAARPDAIENVLAATVGLPRYETIREDLERVIARNRLTQRVRTITQSLEEDISAHRRQAIESTARWGEYYLDDMVEKYGLGYGSYHRLRVAAATDWLTRIVTRAAELDDGSDLVMAVRFLVRAWREKVYTTHDPTGERVRLSENRFLLDYDLAFRIRRLKYLMGKADWLYGYDRAAETAIKRIARAESPVDDLGVADFGERPLTRAEKVEFRAELVALKRAFHPCLAEMRQRERSLETRGRDNPVHGLVMALGLGPQVLMGLLELGSEPREQEAHLQLTTEGREEALVALASDVSDVVRAAREPASAAVNTLLHPRALQPESPAQRLARHVLWHYYQYYGDYDMVSFPIVYSTDAGEQDTVDVIRISPEDATHVFDEKNDALGRRKLAGTALFNFGGFLQDTWRANDILWGRLDGAERLICALLPDPADRVLRDGLLEEASLAILGEEFKQSTRVEVSRLLSESLVSVAAGRAPESAVARLASRAGNQVPPRTIEAAMGECLGEEALLAYFRETYEVNRELDPQTALTALARSSRVVGRLLEGLTERHTHEGKRLRWVTHAANWFWGLVQVAIPRSVASLLANHWLGLFYTLAVLMVVIGVFAGGEIMGWGARILLATGGVHLAVVLLRDLMVRRGRVMAVLIAVLVMVIAGLSISWAWWLLSQPLSLDLLQKGRAIVGLGSWTGMHTVRALCGGLGGLILLASVPALLFRRWGNFLPGGYRQPTLAMEFVANATDLAKLTRGRLVPAADVLDVERAWGTREAWVRSQQGDLPRKLRIGLYVDYVFIAAYWILFLLLADRLVEMAGYPLHGWFNRALFLCGVGAGVAGTAAALLDLVENGRIHEAITVGRGREEDWMALGIRWAAAWKWALVFVTVLLLSPLFLLSAQGGLFSAGRGLVPLGVAWIVVAIGGLAAVIFRPRLLEWAFPALGVGLVAAAYLFAG